MRRVSHVKKYLITNDVVLEQFEVRVVDHRKVPQRYARSPERTRVFMRQTGLVL
jgi:hypothetical protein